MKINITSKGVGLGGSIKKGIKSKIRKQKITGIEKVKTRRPKLWAGVIKAKSRRKATTPRVTPRPPQVKQTRAVPKVKAGQGWTQANTGRAARGRK